MPHNLLTLPTEIRELIWNEYLDLVQNVDVDNHRRAGQQQRTHYLPWTNLQLTNYQIYNEIWDALVRRGRFMTISLRSHNDLILPQLQSQALLALSMQTIHVAITTRRQLYDDEVQNDFNNIFQDLENHFGVVLELGGFDEVWFETRRGRKGEYSAWFDIL